MKNSLKAVIYIFLGLGLGSCVIDETDHIFAVVNSYDKELRIGYLTIEGNVKNIENCKDGDTLKYGITLVEELSSRVEGDEMAEYFVFDNISNAAGQQVSDSLLSEFNNIENWEYELQEDTKDWHRHVYTLFLDDSNLSFE